MDKYWLGYGNSNISSIDNWQDNVAPVNGDFLYFGPSYQATSVNQDITGLSVSGIYISQTSSINLSGYPLTVTGDLTSTNYLQTISCDIYLQNNISINGSGGNGFSINGVVSGGGYVLNVGYDVSFGNLSNSFSGLITINGLATINGHFPDATYFINYGTLILDPYQNESPASIIIVNEVSGNGSANLNIGIYGHNPNVEFRGKLSNLNSPIIIDGGTVKISREYGWTTVVTNDIRITPYGTLLCNRDITSNVHTDGGGSNGIFEAGNGTSGYAISVTSLNLSFGGIYRVRLDGSSPTVGSSKVTSSSISIDSAGLDVASYVNSVTSCVFTILSGSISGTFSGLPEGSIISAGGRSLRINYTGSAVTLTDVLLNVKTWSGASDSNFSTPGNWVGGLAPTSGDSLIFPDGVTNFNPYNDLTDGFVIDTITFTGTDSGLYNLSGNQLNVTNIISNRTSDVYLGCATDNTSSINITCTNGKITCYEVTSPSVVKEGPYECYISTTFSVIGDFTVNGGRLTLGETGYGTNVFIAVNSYLRYTISGSCYAIISGSGTLELYNDIQLLGPVSLMGVLDLYAGSFTSPNQNLPFSNVIVRSGTTYIGNDDYGTIYTEYSFSLEAGAILKLSNSSESVSRSLDCHYLNAASGSELRYLVADSMNKSAINVVNAVDITGVNLSFIALDTSPGDTITILASPSITGTFNGLPEGSVIAGTNGKNYTIHYYTGTVQLSNAAPSVVKTWTGGGTTDNFSDGGNWSGGIAPSSGDELIFTGSTRTSPVNDFTAWTYGFNKITFSSASNFNITGNAFYVEGDIETVAGGTHTINNRISFPSTSVNFSCYNGNLIFNGLIDSNTGFGFTLNNPGKCTINGDVNLAYMGHIYVNNGTLILNGSVSGNFDIYVNSGTTLGGSGTISLSGGEYIHIASGGTVNPGDTSTATLTISGCPIVFEDGSNLIVDLDGSATNDCLLLSSGDLTTTGIVNIYVASAINSYNGREYLPVIASVGTIGNFESPSNGQTITVNGRDLNFYYGSAPEGIVVKITDVTSVPLIINSKMMMMF